MRKKLKYLFTLFVIGVVWAMLFTSQATSVFRNDYSQPESAPPDTSRSKTNRYPLDPTPEYPSAKVDKTKGIQLQDTASIKEKVELDPETGEYVITNKIGKGPLNYRPPRRMTLTEYQQYTMDEAKRNYWHDKASGKDGDKGFAPKYNLAGEAFDKIFGTNVINIQPQGSAELIFGYNVSKIENPTLPVRLRKTPSFNFEERIQMNVQGTIGNRVKIGMQYNTEATFEFENKTKLEYTGEEDEIIKKIEVGNVTMPLTGSLITGSHSLFGIKTEMQFGRLFVTSVMSQQKGQSSTISVQGGAQTSKFEVFADQYEANRHFFLSHFFKEKYDEAMKNIPVISSGIQITRIEVWVTNKSGQFESSRNIAAFMDLGESMYKDYSDYEYVHASGVNNPDSVSFNEANNLYNSVRGKVLDFNNVNSSIFPGMKMGSNFEKIENARKLSERDFTCNTNLGYISINTSLNNDEVLAVAYEFQYRGVTYQVGQFSIEKTNTNIKKQDALVVKLLKGTNFSPKYKNWTLMMKNVYSLNAYQISQEDFMLYVYYQNDRKGTDINYLPESQFGIEKDMLIRILNLDSLNSLNEPHPDGLFDYIEGVTINAANGRIIFPVREPFGKGLMNYFLKKTNFAVTHDSSEAKRLFQKYGYQELYDSTLTKARLISEKNKFKLAGTYKSSAGSEIALNAMNIPQGSVKVTANGIALTENQDFTVDYTLGRVKILNEGVLRSGNPIKVSLENQSLFNMQTKTLVGTNLIYKISDDFKIGGTILHLNERPLTQKVNLYSEPISNTIWGVNGQYRTESNFITTLVDKIPFFSTKAPSEVTLMGEFAQLIPGSAKAIGKNGVAYIDDFEGSETTIELKSLPAWHLSSIPRRCYDNSGDPIYSYSSSDVFAQNYKRAKLCWYVIDPLFTRNNNLTPANIKEKDAEIKADHFVREIPIKEIFPAMQTPNNLATTIPVFNLAFYPVERGAYNYNPDLDTKGNLKNPTNNWGGVMRELQTTDFEAANVQYIEFWLMDPYWKARQGKSKIPGVAGKLYIDIGDITEDVLPDNRKSFENGLPRASVTDTSKFFLDSTDWAIVPTTSSTIKAFDNDEASRLLQDVGLDGMNNDKERIKFKENFLDKINAIAGLDTTAKRLINEDPSADDYLYFRNAYYDNAGAMILERYKKYNGLQGNSPAEKNTQYPSAASTMPDDEDINRDNTLNQSENYYEYEIPLDYNLGVGANPYITSHVDGTPTGISNATTVRWFQFKVPLMDNENMTVIGDKQDFKSVRFLRMYLAGFEDTAILRFAKLELVRGEWRKYNLGLYQGGEYEMMQSSLAAFDITAVNIEKNSAKKPVNYVLPPGIDRVIDPTNPQIRMLNEQAMVLKVTDLPDGDARAAFKTVNLDLRQYKRLKMFVHGNVPYDDKKQGIDAKDGELTVFIRIGADYTNNYYEYEIPLKLTDYGAGEYRKYDNENSNERLEVWPIESTMDIDLEIFQKVKLDRNEKQPNDVMKIFSSTDIALRKAKVSIRGNPSLSNVRAIMIGVRNPNFNDPEMMKGFKETTVIPKNDGLPKTAEIWINELRLTDFNNKGGWGANARSQVKLADLGMVSVSGSTMKPGFGSIEKKVNEREKVETNQLDLATSIDFGKFFKEETGVQLPVFASFSKTVINPEYNPLQPDIPLDVALNEARNRAARDSIKRSAQDYTERMSINIANAKVGKPKQKPKFYDPSNFSTTLSYNHIYSFNPTTYSNQNYNYRGGLNYMFNQRAEPVQPLKNVKFLSKKAFAIVRDFNFYYKPQAIMFRTDMNRNYRRMELRNLNYIPGDTSPTNIRTLEPSFMKDFLWNRMYDVKFDLTRALKLTYNGSNMSRIDEFYDYDLSDPNSKYYDKDSPYQRSPFDDPQYEKLNRDYIWNSISRGGRNIRYNHNIDLTYTIPINKIPGLDWLSSSARYGAVYSWDRQPQLRVPNSNYGNTIKNSNQISLTGQANLLTLYNKIPYLKKLNQPVKKQNKQEYKTVNYEQPVLKMTAGMKKTIKHNLGTEEVKVKVKDKNGVEVKGDMTIVDKYKISFTPEKDQANVTVFVEGKVPLQPSILKKIIDNSLKVMMGIRNVGVTYSLNQGTTLPGFQGESHILGMDPNNQWAPGLPFIFGMQDNSFYKKTLDNHYDIRAYDKNWTLDTSKHSRDILNVPMLVTHNNQLSFRSSIEPFKGMKLDVTAMRNYTESLSKMYLVEAYKEKSGVIMEYDTTSTLKMTGNMSMSFMGIGTFFEKLDEKDGYSSKAFDNFRDKTMDRSQELFLERNQAGDTSYWNYIGKDDSVTKRVNGYYAGYGPSSQEVLLPAFLSAYSGIDMNNKLVKVLIPLNSLFLMMPNWRFTFDGLSKLEVVQKYFKSVVLTHAYQGTYNIGSFISDYKNVENELHYSTTYDLNNNYRSKYAIGSISINESFNPLLGFDMTWVNNVTTRLNYRNSRNLVMSFYNNQLTETRSKEWTVGVGYRLSDLKLNITNTATGKSKEAKNDLKLQCDVSVRDDKTIFRKLVEETVAPNSGKQVVSVKLSADYMLSNSFTLRIFYDRIINTPFVSSSYKTTNSNFGFSVRFTLVQSQ